MTTLLSLPVKEFFKIRQRGKITRKKADCLIADLTYIEPLLIVGGLLKTECPSCQQ